MTFVGRRLLHSIFVLWAVALAVTPNVRRDRVEAGRGKGGQLVPPGIPEFREPVQKKDERSFARFRKVHVDAISLDGTL